MFYIKKRLYFKLYVASVLIVLKKIKDCCGTVGL